MLSILPKPWVKEVPLHLKKHGVLIGVTREAFFPLCLPSQKRERETERERERARARARASERELECPET